MPFTTSTSSPTCRGMVQRHTSALSIWVTSRFRSQVGIRHDDDAALKSRIDICKRPTGMNWSWSLTFTRNDREPSWLRPISKRQALRAWDWSMIRSTMSAFSCLPTAMPPRRCRRRLQDRKMLNFPRVYVRNHHHGRASGCDGERRAVEQERHHYFSVTRAAQRAVRRRPAVAVDDLIWTKIWAESQQITLSACFRRVRTATSGPLGRDGHIVCTTAFRRTGRSRASDPRPLRDEGYD